MEASTADELTSGASGGLNGDSGDQAGKDRLTPTKKKRRHPVARVKGCWGADEDERLVRRGRGQHTPVVGIPVRAAHPSGCCCLSTSGSVEDTGSTECQGSSS